MPKQLWLSVWRFSKNNTLFLCWTPSKGKHAWLLKPVYSTVRGRERSCTWYVFFLLCLLKLSCSWHYCFSVPHSLCDVALASPTSQELVKTLEEKESEKIFSPLPRSEFASSKEESMPTVTSGPLVTSAPRLSLNADVLRSISSESRLSKDALFSPHHPEQPVASIAEIPSFSSVAAGESTYRDSEVRLPGSSEPTAILLAVRSREDRDKSEIEISATESMASSVSIDQGRLPARVKKKKRIKKEQQSRMLSRLRNKNKVLPSVNPNVGASNIASKPPLKAPWLTNDTELPVESVTLGTRKSDHTNTGVLRLPPLSSGLVTSWRAERERERETETDRQRQREPWNKTCESRRMTEERLPHAHSANRFIQRWMGLMISCLRAHSFNSLAQKWVFEHSHTSMACFDMLRTSSNRQC